MSLTQTQLAAVVADRAEISRSEAKRVLEVVLEELGNAQKVLLGGLVQLTVRSSRHRRSARAETRLWVR